jgi:hypothetical protein
MICKLCDFCGEKIAEEDSNHKVAVDGMDFDCCESCLGASVILSERRKVRVRPAKKKSKRTKPIVIDETVS